MNKPKSLLNFIISCFLLVGFLAVPTLAQKTEKIRYSAEGSLENDVMNGEKVKKLIQGVVFKQKNTTIFSDSAYFYEERNAIEAFGKVRIKEGDSINITGNNLLYDGDLKVAKMRGNVVYTDPTMTLYTDFLNYNMIGKLATYYNGGKLIDPENVLTSLKGYYDTEAKFISFKEDVVLVNPEYTLKSDTLQYNTLTKVAYARGPTNIVTNDSTVLNTVEGTFNTTEKQSTFVKGEIVTDNYILTGDVLYGDDLQQIYTATENVKMVSLKDEVIITGEKGWYVKPDGITRVYGNAIMKKIVSQDTLFLSADTLVSIEKPGVNNKAILAYNDVKIF
jgi:lipopolysaccharide assembly outer membrane protein LptD (OstA)